MGSGFKVDREWISVKNGCSGYIEADSRRKLPAGQAQRKRWRMCTTQLSVAALINRIATIEAVERSH